MMEIFFMIVGLISFVLLVIGLFKPSVSLFFISDKGKRKKGLSALIYLVVLVLCMILSSVGDSKKQTESESTDPVEASNEKADSSEQSHWTYSTSQDEMTGKELFFAENESTNEYEFEFPYNGGSRMYLMIRNMDGENEVLVRMNKGQFNLSVNGNENIRIKFGEGEPQTYSYVTSANAAPDIIFINRPEDIIKRLKTAKEIKIDAPFFQTGRVVFNFDVSGLDWNK